MAAFYIHIPYCKQACIYCNFYFSTSLKTKDSLLAAMHKEIADRRSYIGDEAIETIYFGGGTPSLLSSDEIKSLLKRIYETYNITENDLEITLEANPDDLPLSKLNELREAGINRLSIGIQSFKAQDLMWLNRAHTATQSLECINDAHEAGFENITIDLIYGIPGQEDAEWLNNLDLVKSLRLPHFSAYALTVEPKTVLDNMIQKGTTADTDEEQTARHFLMLQQWVEQNGYLAYEISNYCLPGRYSRHNTSYWQGKTYTGIGPSAHSYNDISRQWNIANNNIYIKGINENHPSIEIETLSTDQRYNEYIMTSLRTMWGCSNAYILKNFGQDYLRLFEKGVAPKLASQLLREENDTVFLTLAGKLLADGIASDLFSVPDGDEKNKT